MNGRPRLATGQDRPRRHPGLHRPGRDDRRASELVAELITGGNERHRLEPMAKAARDVLAKAGITTEPTTLLADAGYWNSPQIAELEERGTKVLCPPDADLSDPGFTYGYFSPSTVRISN